MDIRPTVGMHLALLRYRRDKDTSQPKGSEFLINIMFSFKCMVDFLQKTQLEKYISRVPICTFSGNLRSRENHDTFPGDLVFKMCACGNFILSFVPWRSQNASLPMLKLNPQIRETYDQNASAEKASKMPHWN